MVFAATDVLTDSVGIYTKTLNENSPYKNWLTEDYMHLTIINL